MHNIITLFKNDMKRLVHNLMSIIILIGLVVTPSLFAWYNIIACWNVFDNTGNLTVAVASNDEGYKSELFPLEVNIGEQVISALRANDDIDWTFTNADDAIDGARDGRYYAAIVIPASFSKDMLTFYTSGAEPAAITYYANEKKNAIAPKMTDRSADSVSYQINQVFAQTISDIGLGLAQSLADAYEQGDFNNQVSVLSQNIRDTGNALGEGAAAISLYANLLDSLDSLVRQTSSTVSSLRDDIDSFKISDDAVSSHRAKLDDAIAKLDDALNNIGTIESPTLPALPEFDKAKAALEKAKQAYTNELRPALKTLSSSLSGAASSAEPALGNLKNTCTSVIGAIDSFSGDFSSAATQTSDISGKLKNASLKMIEVADKIDAALASNNADELKKIIGGDIESFSSALSAPIGIDREVLFPSESFGSAMAPLYTALALFIGSLLIMVVVRVKVGKRAQAELLNPKPSQMFLGRYLTVIAISLMQSTLMALGNIFFLQVQACHPWLLMLCFWFAGIVFTSIIYALVAAFANLGKAIAVLMLIIQVTGCGGSFPLQIMPDFVQWLSPWLPATHVVNAMRDAMMGAYGMDFWIQMGELALFLLPAALIGLVLQQPLSTFMHWYLEKVESSKLMA